MNATATTAQPVPTELGIELEIELDRILELAAEPRTSTVATSPLCLCWPDADE